MQRTSSKVTIMFNVKIVMDMTAINIEIDKVIINYSTVHLIL